MIDDIKKRLDAGTDIGEHIHHGVSSGSCAGGAHIEEKPTFDDLIDVAVKAYKDGVLKSLKLLDYGVHSLSYSVDANGDGDENTIFSQHEDYSDGIDFINSLYIETFVIKSEEDINLFKSQVESIVLANGEEIINDVMFHRNKPYFTNGGVSAVKVGFNVLKGATVTQKIK